MITTIDPLYSVHTKCVLVYNMYKFIAPLETGNCHCSFHIVHDTVTTMNKEEICLQYFLMLQNLEEIIKVTLFCLQLII